jgi:Zn-dependent protease
MNFDLWRTLDLLPGILVGLTVHEAAHAWTASRLGDDTARQQGRVSLNPWQHFDILGFALIVFAGFGWAKPVEFREAQLRRPERDPILIALAGPSANILCAVAFAFAYALTSGSFHHGGAFGNSLAQMLFLAIFTNWGLALFNLLPIPPLDGSHVCFWWLRRSNPTQYAALYRYGTWVLLILVVATSRLPGGIPFLGDAVNWLSRATLRLAG